MRGKSTGLAHDLARALPADRASGIPIHADAYGPHLPVTRVTWFTAFVSLSFAFVTAAPQRSRQGRRSRRRATQPPAPAQRSTQANEQQTFSQDELDALLAPSALYPDGLLAQVLMAATYPLDVVHADRFLKQNRSLHGPALEDTVAEKNSATSACSRSPRIRKFWR